MCGVSKDESKVGKEKRKKGKKDRRREGEKQERGEEGKERARGKKGKRGDLDKIKDSKLTFGGINNKNKVQSGVVSVNVWMSIFCCRGSITRTNKKLNGQII